MTDIVRILGTQVIEPPGARRADDPPNLPAAARTVDISWRVVGHVSTAISSSTVTVPAQGPAGHVAAAVELGGCPAGLVVAHDGLHAGDRTDVVVVGERAVAVDDERAHQPPRGGRPEPDRWVLVAQGGGCHA